MGGGGGNLGVLTNVDQRVLTMNVPGVDAAHLCFPLGHKRFAEREERGREVEEKPVRGGRAGGGSGRVEAGLVVPEHERDPLEKCRPGGLRGADQLGCNLE